MPLIERDDSMLIVIDLQPSFWGERLAAGDAASAVTAASRASWLAVRLALASATRWRPASRRVSNSFWRSGSSVTRRWASSASESNR